MALPVHVEPQHMTDMLTTFVVSDINAPPFQKWTATCRTEEERAAKIAYLHEQNAPYVVYNVKVSRVADYYQSFFNFWQPRGNTGYLDIDCRQEPSLIWKERANAIDRLMQELGFIRLEPSLQTEILPFILTWGGDAIPEDDPRWDTDDWGPDPVPAIVHDCLFDDQ